jgi:hypothetical protein
MVYIFLFVRVFLFMCCEACTYLVICLRYKMASGFGNFEEFLNIMRSDTTEEVTPVTQVTWFAVDNTSIVAERSLLDFGDLRSGDLKQLASPGEGWGSVTENADFNVEVITTTAATISEAFTWMATSPGMVLIGTFTLGGKCYYYTEFKISWVGLEVPTSQCKTSLYMYLQGMVPTVLKR